MNKIVHEHLKASELPAKLREGIDSSATVTVTIQEEPPRQRRTLNELRARLDEERGDRPGISTDEAVARIRALRDEWDD